MGVKPFYKKFKHNGVNGPNMAAVLSTMGPRASGLPLSSTTVRTRPPHNSNLGDFDWNSIFSGGIRWFHSAPIFAALSETTGELIIEGMKAAKKAGAIVSFDLNFREKLWNILGRGKKSRRGSCSHC